MKIKEIVKRKPLYYWTTWGILIIVVLMGISGIEPSNGTFNHPTPILVMLLALTIFILISTIFVNRMYQNKFLLKLVPKVYQT